MEVSPSIAHREAYEPLPWRFWDRWELDDTGNHLTNRLSDSRGSFLEPSGSFADLNLLESLEIGKLGEGEGLQPHYWEVLAILQVSRISAPGLPP